MDATLEKTLRMLVEVFLKENSFVNLSAHRTEEACWVGNVLDSIVAIDVIRKIRVMVSSSNHDHAASFDGAQDDTWPMKFLDIGTGGGFPLLPLAIAMPDADCTGMDATGKKVKAVARMAEALGLKNVHVLHGRAEDIAQTGSLRGTFDVVLARAVAELPTLLAWTAPFARRGGMLLLWKSLRVDDELRQSLPVQRTLGLTLEERNEYTLPGNWGTRQLLLFRRV